MKLLSLQSGELTQRERAIANQLLGNDWWSNPLVNPEVGAVEPTNKTAGMIAYADGVGWNPGSMGAGYYAYIGAAWVKLQRADEVIANATKLATARLISGVAFDGSADITLLDQILHVRDEKPTATAGGASVAGDQIRTLNTVVKNTITDASLAANEITLPAGTYKVRASAPAWRPDRHRVRMVNVTDAAVALLGSSALTAPGDSVTTNSFINGVITITAVKKFNLTHYIQTAAATSGLGVETNDTFVNVYAEIMIEKIG